MPAELRTLLEMTVMASAMIAAVLAVRSRLSRRMHPAVMLALWGLVLLRLCLPVTFASPVHLPDLLPKQAAAQPGPAAPAPSAPPEIRMPLAEGLAPQAKASAGGQGAMAAAPRPDAAGPSIAETLARLAAGLSPWAAAASAWALGAAAVLLTALRRGWRFRRRLRMCRGVAGGRVPRAVRRHKLGIGIRRDVEVLECDFVQAPAVFGCFRPVILLPTQFLRHMDRARLDGILLHELCHIKRRDMLLNYAWLLAKAVHWFNPLVWAAYRAFQADVELCRDRMVGDRLGPAARLDYGQSLIDAARFVNRTRAPLPSSAASLFGSESKVKERVVRLIRPQKRSRISVLASAALAALMLLTCFTTACQPTPTKPVVVNKNSGEMEKKINSTPVPAATPAQGSPDASGSQAPSAAPAPTPAPIKLKDSFPGADETVTINIDADVTMPGGKVPVVEIKPRTISMEQIKAMASVLFQGSTAYEPKMQMSKEDLNKEILKLKQFISSNDAMLEYYGGDQKTVDDVKKMFEKRISNYEKLKKTAPDSIPRKETDWTFRPYADYVDMVVFGEDLDAKDDQTVALNRMYYDSDAFEIDADIDRYHARIDVMNLETDKDIRHSASFYIGSDLSGVNSPRWNEADERPMTLTQDATVTMVADALEKMGISNMRLSRCEPQGKPQGPELMNLSPKEAAAYAAGEGGTAAPQGSADDNAVYGYYMSFVPTFEGVAAAAMGDGIDFMGENPYGPTYGYDQLNVTVQNDMITSLRWDSPVEQVKVENSNIAMLPLEDIVAAFKKQMQLEYTLAKLSRYAPENPDYKEYVARLESGEIDIKSVSLALVRIFIQDRPGAYRMVPAWIFSGTEKLKVKDAKEEPALPPGKAFNESQFTYMVINAIDGSIINPAAGY